MVTYNEIPPHHTLTNYIDSYWLSENLGTTKHDSLILPDCCMDIIFNFSDNTIIICGVMTSARTVTMKPNQKMFGVRFLPGVLPALLNIPAIKFTDSVIPLEKIDTELATSLRGLFDTPKQDVVHVAFCMDVLEPKLLAIDKTTMLDLSKLPTDYSVRGLSQYLDTSVRQTQRIFAKRIGITPKRFLQIKRFMALQQELPHNESSLAYLSVTNGYFDHAHMRKEHQILTNTPARH